MAKTSTSPLVERNFRKKLNEHCDRVEGQLDRVSLL